MRTRTFLVAALIAFGFAACNNEDVPYFSGEEGAPATISVRVFAEGLSTRNFNLEGDRDLTATGTGSIDANEQAIHSLQVFLFNTIGTGQFVDSEFFRLEDLDTTDDGYLAAGIKTTSGQRTMVVVANHPQIHGAVSKQDLLNSNFASLTQNIADNGIVMTAVVEDPFTLVAGENLYGAPVTPAHGNLVGTSAHHSPANLELVRINARVALVSLTFDNSSGDERFDTFVLTDVAMFNVRNQTRLFNRPADNAWNLTNNATFSFGAPFPSRLNSYRRASDGAIEDFGLLARFPGGTKIPAFIDASPIRQQSALFFYTFENAGDPIVDRLINDQYESVRRDQSGTFIVLRGYLYDSKTGVRFTLPDIYTCPDKEFTYYAIWVNCDKLGTVIGHQNAQNLGDNSILRNRQYNLSVRIWGAGNPTIDPAIRANLDVHVEVKPWRRVSQEVDWGTPRPTNQRDAGVVINGTRWATRNVAAFGTFADSPYDAGMLFQWNSNTAWSVTDPITSIPADATWQTAAELAGDTWNNGRGPCPPGWRLPTKTELASLGEGSLATNGRIFGTSPNQLFLPAAPSRLYNNGEGELFNFGVRGSYWSNIPYDSEEVIYLSFIHALGEGFVNESASAPRQSGFSVRCVAR